MRPYHAVRRAACVGQFQAVTARSLPVRRARPPRVSRPPPGQSDRSVARRWARSSPVPAVSGGRFAPVGPCGLQSAAFVMKTSSRVHPTPPSSRSKVCPEDRRRRGCPSAPRRRAPALPPRRGRGASIFPFARVSTRRRPSIAGHSDTPPPPRPAPRTPLARPVIAAHRLATHFYCLHAISGTDAVYAIGCGLLRQSILSSSPLYWRRHPHDLCSLRLRWAMLRPRNASG